MEAKRKLRIRLVSIEEAITEAIIALNDALALLSKFKRDEIKPEEEEKN